MTDDRFSVEGIRREAERKKTSWLEFFRVKSMSLGFYRLAKGASDTQTPHREDEIYYVHKGRARFRVAGRETAVKPGDVLYVPANTEHWFSDIEESLELLVVFAPAESTGNT